MKEIFFLQKKNIIAISLVTNFSKFYEPKKLIVFILLYLTGLLPRPFGKETCYARIPPSFYQS